jgi:hypothetical protein
VSRRWDLGLICTYLVLLGFCLLFWVVVVVLLERLF